MDAILAKDNWLNNEGPNKQTFGERWYSLDGG
jgi:hypothetical protein